MSYDDPCDRPYGPGNPDYQNDGRWDAQDAADMAAREQAERDLKNADWWTEKLGSLSLGDDAAKAIARCMANLDAACNGCPISRSAINEALAHLQKVARLDARDERRAA